MNIKTQCCGFVLLMVIFYFYLSRRKIKLKTSQAFLRLCAITMLQLVLDILSIILLANNAYIPDLIVDNVCRAYISSLVLLSMSALWYICTDIYGNERQLRKVQLFSACFAALGIVLIFLLPIYKSLENPDLIYTYGPSVSCTYVFAVFFLICIVLLLILKKREIDPRRRNAMQMWIILWLAAAATQFMFNNMLMVGFASTVGIAIVFLKLENPELNTDISTGMFNREGMMLYIDQLYRSGKEFSIIDAVVPKFLTGDL